jgi:signal peptidase I
MTESVQSVPPDQRRKPWVAFLLSWPCPGLGHLYAGDLWGMLFSLLLVYLALTLPLPFALNQSAPSTVWILWLGRTLIIIVVPIYAWLSARRAARPYELKPYNRWYVYVGVWLGWAVLSQLVIEKIRSGVVQAYRVPSGSMEPTILVGDFIYVDKRPATRASVTRGDIITFSSVEDEGIEVIKRVVGIPGDTVAMVEGKFFRNGIAIIEPYILPPEGRSEEEFQRAKMKRWQSDYLVGELTTEYQPDLEDWGPLVVPAQSYLVLGDNRDQAYDSRYWGFVPVENVTGQPSVVYWSYDRESYKPLPYFFAVRWNRIGRGFSP